MGGELLTGVRAQQFVESTLGYTLEELAPYPKYILLEPLFACNARCIMCGIDFDREPRPRPMDGDLFEKIAQDLAASRQQLNKVWVFGRGEPLMDRRLELRIRRLKELGIEWVGTQTNASPLNDTRGRGLIEAGLDEVYITIDSLDAEVFEKIRVGLKFQQVYDNTLRFIELRDRLAPDLRIRVQMVQQELNWDEPAAFKEHWKPLLGPNDQIAVQKAHNWAKEVDVVKFGDEDSINSIPCISLWGTAFIYVDGTVGLCCMDTANAYPLGNLREQSMTEIWQGEPIRKMRQLHLAGRRCEFGLCDGCTTWRPEKRELEEQLGIVETLD